MAGISIKIDKEDLANVESAMVGVKNGYAKVLVRSLNKTILGVRTDAVKEIGKEITPKAKIIRDTFVLSKATYAWLKATVKSTGWPVPVIHYAARSVKKGVTYKIRQAGGRLLLKHAFIATMKSGHKGVFWREYKGTPTKKVKPNVKYGALPERMRLPISQRYGPAVQDIFGDNKVMEPILKKAGDRLSKELNHQLDFELSKL